VLGFIELKLVLCDFPPMTVKQFETDYTDIYIYIGLHTVQMFYFKVSFLFLIDCARAHISVRAPQFRNSDWNNSSANDLLLEPLGVSWLR